MNRQTTQPRVADEMSARRKHAGHRRCRWTTYGIKTQRYWCSAGCNLNLLWEVRRFHAYEINAQFFNLRDKLGPPDNTYNFAIAIRHRATWEFAAFNAIQSSAFSFTNSSKRRTAVVGLMFNIEAVLASIEGGTTKRPPAGARTFSDQVNVPNGMVTRSPTLTLVTPGPIASTIPAPSPPMTEGSFGFKK